MSSVQPVVFVLRVAPVNHCVLKTLSSLGYGHDAQAIQLGANSPLYNAFNDMFGTMIGGNLIRLLTRLYPVLSFLVRLFLHPHLLLAHQNTSIDIPLCIFGGSCASSGGDATTLGGRT